MTLEEIGKKYQLTADYHTHTVYSVAGPYRHAKSTILDNVAAAYEKGLTEVAITDHGPKELYGHDPELIPEMRREIAEAEAKYPEVKVHLGVEANIMDSPNGLDVEPENFKDYDFVNAGYHYGVPHCNMIANWISFHLACSERFKEKVCKKNTELAIRALYNNDIKVLTHPGDKAFFDMEALGKACEETDTLVEINARHKRPNVDDLKILAKYDVKFVISSDAHSSDKVGRYVKSVALALDAGVLDRVINVKER